MELETPEFVDGRALLLAGLDGRFTWSTMREIGAQWMRLGPHLGRIPEQKDPVAWGASHENSKEGFRYLCGVEVAGGSDLLEGFITLQVPAQRYAVFPHREHVDRICETFAAIWSKWLPESGQRIVDSPIMLERYGEGFDPQTGKGDITIWIPIQP